MKGTRLNQEPNSSSSEYQSIFAAPEGSYWKGRDGTWYCKTPGGHYGNLKAHDVTEHEDGTITVSPSILVSSNGEELYHGYLKNGEWSEA